MSNIWEELEHHGIMGMKWGVRRYQPYPKGEGHKGTYKGRRDARKKEKAKTNAEYKKNNPHLYKKAEPTGDIEKNLSKAVADGKAKVTTDPKTGKRTVVMGKDTWTMSAKPGFKKEQKAMKKADKKWNDKGAKPIKKHIREQQKEVDRIVEKHVKALKGEEATTKQTQDLLKEIYDHMNKTALAKDFSKSPSGTKVLEFNPVIIGDNLLFKVVEKPIKQKKKASTIKHSIQNGNINNQDIVDSILRKHGLERRY